MAHLVEPVIVYERSEEAPEAERVTLEDVLRQIDASAVEALMDKLHTRDRRAGPLRATCRALRDLVDANVRFSGRLTLQLREDGAVTEPLASLARWGRRGGLGLLPTLPATAPGCIDSLLPAGFQELPEPVRRRVTDLLVTPADHKSPCPAVSGEAVGALAASLPGLRSLNLHNLPATWTPGDAGEAYTALAALGTLEELELPGVPGLTGVEALAGSLRSLKLWDQGSSRHALTLPAATSIGHLSRLETLHMTLHGLDLGEGPAVPALLHQLPRSVRTLKLALRDPDDMSTLGFSLYGTFGLSGGRMVSAKLHSLELAELAALAEDKLLPCLGPGERLESLSVSSLSADGRNAANVSPLLELWRSSDRACVEKLAAEEQHSAADVCSALAALGPVDTFVLSCHPSVDIRLPRPPMSHLPSCGQPPDLPSPEELVRMALQRITTAPAGAGANGGTDDGGGDLRGGRIFLVRGPAAAGALEQPRRSAAVTAWAVELERQARASAAGASLPARAPLVTKITPLPCASAVLIKVTDLPGAAQAVAAAVVAAGGGSEAARAWNPRSTYSWHDALGWGLGEVMSELWAASCVGEGGPSLQQRVEWALRVLVLLEGLPATVAPWGWFL